MTLHPLKVCFHGNLASRFMARDCMSFLITGRGISSLITCLIGFWNAFWARTQEPLGAWISLLPINRTMEEITIAPTAQEEVDVTGKGNQILRMGGGTLYSPSLRYVADFPPQLPTSGTFISTGLQCQKWVGLEEKGRGKGKLLAGEVGECPHPGTHSISIFALKIQDPPPPLCN